MLVIFADTDCDVTAREAEKYGFRLISMPYSVDDRTVYPYEDFKEFDDRTYYDMLRSGVVPSTSSVSAEKYKEYFEPVFAAGDDILYVHFSRAMSGTFELMDNAVAQLLSKYPERKFHAVDTGLITIGALSVLREIGEMARAGKSVEELIARAKELSEHTAVYFFADDLRFFRHSGRVSGLTGIMGTLLGVRPIIYINENGQMLATGKEKGRRAALERLVRAVEELGEELFEHDVIIGHTDAPDIAEEIKDMLIERFGEQMKPEVIVVNPTAGAHCGPDSVGVAFHAKHR